jgi:hypothetical protein
MIKYFLPRIRDRYVHNNKPHIRFVRFVSGPVWNPDWFGLPGLWWCSDDGEHSTSGRTPSEAYKNWFKRIRL